MYCIAINMSIRYAIIAEVEIQQTDKQLDATLKHLPNKQQVKTNKNDPQKYFIDFDFELYLSI